VTVSHFQSSPRAPGVYRPGAFAFCIDCGGTLASLGDLAMSNGHGSGWLSAHRWLRYLDDDYSPEVEELRRGVTYVMSIGHERLELFA
jgi:hypothetical protein